MITNKISAVLPLRVAGCRDGRDDERAKILFSSLAAFTEADLFFQIYVVVPILEYRNLCKVFTSFLGLPIEVIPETEVEPNLSEYSGLKGWAKQQILKIAIANRIQTTYYLTLDADVIACKPINKQRLFVDGKGLLQRDAKAEPDTHFNRSWWWDTSASILDVKNKHDEHGIAVTPVLLSTEVSKMLMIELGSKSPRNLSWIDALLQKNRSEPLTTSVNYLNWSEYSLYYLFLEKLWLVNKYHFLRDSYDEGFIMLSLNSFGFSKSTQDLGDLDVDAFFSKTDNAMFFVIQSDKEIDPEFIRQSTKMYFNTFR